MDTDSRSYLDAELERIELNLLQGMWQIETALIEISQNCADLQISVDRLIKRMPLSEGLQIRQTTEGEQSRTNTQANP